MKTLRVLGGATIEGPEGPLSGPVTYRHNVALLTMLAMAEGRALGREKLAALLWPDRDEEHARHSLANAVHVLRSELGETSIASTGGDLALSLDDVGCDAIEFERAVDRGDDARAADLYRGPFLDGFHLDDADEFERWVQQHRRRLARMANEVRERLAEAAMERGAWSSAIRWWDAVAATDPYGSRAVVGVMSALAASGDRAEALRRAEAHARLLAEDLDAEPDPTVAALASELKEAPPGWVPPRVVRNEAVGHDDDRGADPAASVDSGRRVKPIVATALVAVVLMAGYFSLRGRVGLDPSTAASDDAGPGIAVLPFEVRGEGLDVWREGMVDLLSTGLDGAAGLRGIDSRTLFARWEERTPEKSPADLATALRTADATGARYAVVGSVVALGDEVRFVADIYDLDDEENLGRAQVQGPRDDALQLVDLLAFEILGVILAGEENLPSVALASLTTDSLAALKAYLEGEGLFRRGDFEAAFDAYERAIEIDSTFALAYQRILETGDWAGGARRIRSLEVLDPLGRFHDRLPARERLLVSAFVARTRSSPSVISGSGLYFDDLLDGVRKYPDDPRLWYELGETRYHSRAQTLSSMADTEEAFRHAVDLDPGMVSYRSHLIELSFRDDPDSVSVARTFEDHADPKEAWPVRVLAFELAYGDSVTRRRALSVLDTLEPRSTGEVYGTLSHPRLHEAAEPAFSAMLEKFRSRGWTRWALRARIAHAYERGHLRKALTLAEELTGTPMWMRETSTVACGPYELRIRGLPVRDSLLDRTLVFFGADTITNAIEGWNGWPACVGAHAADGGRWDEYERAVNTLRERTGVALRGRDSLAARTLTADAIALEGYGLWKRGRSEEALSELGRALPESDLDGLRWWIVDLLIELERPAETIQYLASYWRDPLARYRLGKIHEELGEYDQARKAYDYFVEAWKHADPELQPMVEEARQAMIRLEKPRGSP